MDHNSDGELEELLWQLADLRGAESVRAMHSVLVEAAIYCDSMMGLSVIDDINKFGLSRDFDTSEKGYVCRAIYNRFRINIFQEKDEDDSSQVLQEVFPLFFAEALQINGLENRDILIIITKGIDNTAKNPLWEIYRNNIYIAEL
uniref:hypothetical protein n=1 Tax=uncultured Rhizobium sp. TaxID=155567 RepID=UPI002610E2E6|nr:hypothetical protein [uncultured Rhizobium sp.]